MDFTSTELLDWVTNAPDGDDGSWIRDQIRKTQVYADRFAGNEERRKNGFGVLSEREYIDTENAMETTLRNYGLPADFYDNPARDFAKIIGLNKSPQEVEANAKHAWEFTQSADPAMKRALSDLYGVNDDADIAAYFLDPEKGQALIEKRATAATLAAIADRNGIRIGRFDAERFTDQGVSTAEAQRGFGDAAQAASGLAAVGSRFGEQYTSADAVDDFVGGSAKATDKRRRVAGSEAALFNGGGSQPAAGGASSRGAF
jgi:hypothetical protein